MLSRDDQLLIERDRALPGLGLLLDTDRFVELVARSVPEIQILGGNPTYLRYKPATSCLAGFQLYTSAGVVDVHGITYRERETAKLYKDTSVASRGALGAGAFVSHADHVAFHVFPNDMRLGSLRVLGDDVERTQFLRKLLPKREDLWNAQVKRLAYKPHRRYVAMLSTDGAPRAVLKFYTREGFDIAVRNARAIGSTNLLRTPKRMGRSARHRVACHRWIEGELLRTVANPEPSILRRVGAALTELHRQDAPQLPVLGRDAEAVRLRAAADAIGGLLPNLRDRARALARRLVALWPQPARIVTIHGDFHARQVLLTRRKIAILDLDEAVRSSPMADLGDFIAHLHRHAGAEDRADESVSIAADALVSGFREAAGEVDEAELSWHTAAALLRLAPHPFRAREVDWSRRTQVLLDRVQRILEEHEKLRGHRFAPSQGRVVDDRFGIEQDEKLAEFASLALDAGWMSDRLAARVNSIHVVRHKPGRRCLVEYELDGFTAVGKLRAKGADRSTYRLLRALRDEHGFDDDAPDGICVPAPIALLEDAGMWLQRKVPATPATELLRGPDGAALAARIAEAAVKLHRSRASAKRVHAIHDELRILRERFDEVIRQQPQWELRINEVYAACEQLAAGLPPPPATCGIHRDFYADHVLAGADGRLWLIDLDLYCEGDPALDIGNFLAHLTEQGLRETGDPAALSHARRAMLDRFGELTGDSMVARVHTFALLTLARHIAISARLPERRHLTPVLISLCERHLHHRQSAEMAM